MLTGGRAPPQRAQEYATPHQSPFGNPSFTPGPQNSEEKETEKRSLTFFNSVFPGHSQSHKPFNLDTAPALASFAQIMSEVKGRGSKETLKGNHLIVLDAVL